MATLHHCGRPHKDPAKKISRTLVFKLTEDELNFFLEKFKLYQDANCEELGKEKPVPKKTKKNFFITAISNGGIPSVNKQRFEALRDMAKLKSDIAHIGANINQVAHVVNTIGYATTEEKIAMQLEQLSSSLRLLDGLSQKLSKTMMRVANE